MQSTAGINGPADPELEINYANSEIISKNYLEENTEDINLKITVESKFKLIQFHRVN